MLKLGMVALFCLAVFSNETQAGEKSLYDFLWLDPDKKVYVLQNKIHKKEHSFYADLGYITNFTSKFQDTTGFAGRVGFYLHEDWGIELFYNLYSNANNDEYKNIRQLNVEPFIRRIQSSYGALAIWSPFYGKINTFNQIFYFDWSFGAGLGKVNAESNLETVALGANIPPVFLKEDYTAGIIKTKLKFHIQENIHLGLEYMNTYYMAPGPRNPNSDKLRTNTDIIMSVGFSY